MLGTGRLTSDPKGAKNLSAYKELVLYYDPAGLAAKAKWVFTQQRIRIKTVTPELVSETVGALAGLTVPEPETGTAVQMPAEPVLVFCGLRSSRLDAVLAALQKAGVPRSVYKAVLTESNAAWRFDALCAELARERAALRSGGRA